MYLWCTSLLPGRFCKLQITGKAKRTPGLIVAVKLGEPKGPGGVWYPNFHQPVPSGPFHRAGEQGWERP